eukprot:CAMPEP_0168459914 /NCGR_PEP_ID=MMETSP0228-20121227/53169_1 /TAXON_ID=133427 /ORGANISM="Protoceratium reticulatum, Strain CCCM 535 (=CCMP 1889)" /LENGTH=50 /DNA_ID=CAMNT_0008475121 /DNA_START=102 /DNA_END=251 /DNA_ORIENTATION=-
MALVQAEPSMFPGVATEEVVTGVATEVATGMVGPWQTGVESSMPQAARVT